MKMFALLVTIVVLIAQGAIALANNPYGKIVDTSCLRICQAAMSHKDDASAVIGRAQQSWIPHRFEKPVAIKLRRVGQHGLMLKLCYAKGEYLSFCADGKLRRQAPDGITRDPAVSDIQVPPDMAKMSSSCFGKEAAATGYDAFYDNGKPVLRKKFFRQGMTESQRKLATTSTLAHDLGQPDWMQVRTDTTVNYMRALMGVRSEAEQLLWFSRDDRWYDWREFPMPIQKSISDAIELCWIAAQWQFLSEVATHIR